MATGISNTSATPSVIAIPPLCAGDRLTRDEFERRYAASPNIAKAELIEGVVYVQFAVRFDHGFATSDLNAWLAVYASQMPGVKAFDNATVRLDIDNEPQPDAGLLIEPPFGQVAFGQDRYLEGAPELVAEVAVTSASYDLHDKLNAYRRNGVREYIVWRVMDCEIDWFRLHGGRYEQLAPAPSGIFQSEEFPGLWLDKTAMIQRDMARVLQVLQHGIASPEAGAFGTKMRERRQN